MKILVADDELISRRLVENLLKRAGYDVIAVENGRLAAEYLSRADGPRLALLDWVMPDLDGPGVCREIRNHEDHPYVYAILLTLKDSKEDLVGGLEAGADDYLTKPFHPAELKIRLRTGARILRLEDKLVEAREHMRFQATHDPLTGVWNRRAVMEALEMELRRSHREKAPVTVLLGDLDHFKQINDTHGHIAGDEVLKEIARRLKASVRTYDLVGRYGGEEFLMVLVNCGRDGALARCENIRESVATDQVETASGPIGVTVSIGVAVACGRRANSLVELLHSADLALYQAKAEGRNCVKLASDDFSSRVNPTAIEEI